jgi:TatD DNase family protein
MIDSHAHVMFDSFDSDRDQVIKRMPEAGVTGWIEIATNLEQSRQAVALAQQYDTCWAAVGVHPDDISELNEDTWPVIEELLQKPKVVAVGEVGFDFYREGKREQQEPVLRRFVELAQARQLPVVFHVRDTKGTYNAHEAMVEFLKSYSDADRPHGVLHTFSGTREHAQQYLELGMYLSFSGVITFKNAGPILDVVKTMPLGRLLIETDCPFLAPEPYRGKRNEPAYVRFVAQKIAELRQVSLEEINRLTHENTKRLFKLS